MNEPIRLTGLNAANPLGFLAALGTLRLTEAGSSGARIRMRWVQAGIWQPELEGAPCEAKELPEFLLGCPRAGGDAFTMLGSKNLTVAPESFGKLSDAARASARQGDRMLADYTAAFGCEAIEDRKPGRIQYTDFCFITGSGHQDFLGTARALEEQVKPEHLDSALFGPWRRDKKLSMRWDPEDAAEYALQWGDPSKAGASAVWGANWLAFHGLPCFPAQPNRPYLRTTGFFRATRRDPEFRWPVWEGFVSLGAARSLLSLSQLQDAVPNLEELAGMGIPVVYRAPRVRIGQGANFKVSFRPASVM